MPGRSRTHNHCYIAAIGTATILFACSANPPVVPHGFATGDSYLGAAPLDGKAREAAAPGAPTTEKPVQEAGKLAVPAANANSSPASPAAAAVAKAQEGGALAQDASNPSQDWGTAEASVVPSGEPKTGGSGSEPGPSVDPILLDERELEKDLRHELATAADPTDVALELAGLLTDLERPREALAALEAAMSRRPGPRLSIAHAAVQRDLGQRHLAVAELERLRATQGALAVAPGVLLELAELQWLEGHGDTALATLTELRRAYSEDAWWTTNGTPVEQLALEVNTRSAPQRLRLRDLLGNLRGAPNQLVRLRTLEEIVHLADHGKDSSEAQQRALAGLRERAIAIACGDEHPVVRARAIQLAKPVAATAMDFCAAAFGDASPVVRSCVAPRCAEWLGRSAIPLLLEVLAKETDGAAFRAMHEALGSLVTEAPQLLPQDEDKAERRLVVTAAWRQRCRS